MGSLHIYQHNLFETNGLRDFNRTDDLLADKQTTPLFGFPAVGHAFGGRYPATLFGE